MMIKCSWIKFVDEDDTWLHRKLIANGCHCYYMLISWMWIGLTSPPCSVY